MAFEGLSRHTIDFNFSLSRFVAMGVDIVAWHSVASKVMQLLSTN